MPITIKVNGQDDCFEQPMDLLSLLEMLDISPVSVVLELNRKVICREMFEEVILKDGDELELVQFVGGG